MWPFGLSDGYAAASEGNGPAVIHGAGDMVQEIQGQRFSFIHYVFKLYGVSINWGIQIGWIIMKNPIKMDDLGVPLFHETTLYIYIYTL